MARFRAPRARAHHRERLATDTLAVWPGVHPSRRSLAPRPRRHNFLPKRACSCSPARPSCPLTQVPGRWCYPVASCPFVRSRHVATSRVPAEWMGACGTGCGRATGGAQLLRCAGTVGEKQSFDHVPQRDGGAFFQVVPEWLFWISPTCSRRQRQRSVLPGVKQTVPRSETYAGIQALRNAPRKNPLVLISDDEYFVSTTQKGRAHQVCQWCVLWQPVLGRGRPLWQSRFSKSRASEWSRWSGQSANLDVRVEP